MLSAVNALTEGSPLQDVPSAAVNAVLFFERNVIMQAKRSLGSDLSDSVYMGCNIKWFVFHSSWL